MEKAIETIISGDLNTASLLMLFIIGILTKRFVPWWVHEEALDKLDEYERTAPVLMDEVTTLIDILNNDPQFNDAFREHEHRTSRRRVADKTAGLKVAMHRNKRARRPRKRSGA